MNPNGFALNFLALSLTISYAACFGMRPASGLPCDADPLSGEKQSVPQRVVMVGFGLLAIFGVDYDPVSLTPNTGAVLRLGAESGESAGAIPVIRELPPDIKLPFPVAELEGKSPENIQGILASKGIPFKPFPSADKLGEVYEFTYEGITFQIRPHVGLSPWAQPGQAANVGSTTKFGFDALRGKSGTLENILRAEQALVKMYDIPGLRPHPRTGYFFVDDFGYAYFDIGGNIGGLITDATHLLGFNHPWSKVIIIRPR